MTFNFLRKLLRRQTTAVTNPHLAASGSVRRSHRLVLELLEDRTVLSTPGLNIDSFGNLTYTASPGVTNNLTVSVAGGNYTFRDTGQTITLGSGTALWSGGGTNVVTGPSAGVNSISIDLADQNDTANIQSINAPTTVLGGAGNDTINVCNNAPTNTGTLAGIAAALTVTADAGTDTLVVSNFGTTTGDSNVVIGSNTISGFAGPGGATPITYSSAGGAFGLMRLLGSNSVSLAEQFTLQDPGAPVQLDTDAGPSTVNVQAVSSPATLNGGSGNDTFNLSSDAPANLGTLDGINAALTIDARGGSNALHLSDFGQTVTPNSNVVLTAVGLTEQITGFASSAKNQTVTYRAVGGTFGGGVSLDGSNALGDSFTVNSTLAGSPAPQIRGNGGNDSFTLGGPAVAVSFDGGAGTNQLTGSGTGSTYTISGTNAGNVNTNATFQNVENLVGGAGNDTFQLTGTATLSGSINGGSGANTLDYSGYGAGITLDATTNPGTATGLGGFTGIQNFIGSNFADTFTLKGQAFTQSVDGRAPSTSPGDTLNYVGSGNPVSITPTTITETGFANPTVTYTNIETLSPTGSPTNTVVPGTNSDDTLLLNTIPNGIQYTLNGGPVQTLTNINSFEFDGLAGNDRMSVDVSSGNALPPGGVLFDGGTNAGPPADRLRVVGVAGQSANYLPDAATVGMGSVNIAGLGTASFKNAQGVDMTGFGTATLTTPNGNDAVTVQNGTDFFGGVSPSPAVQFSGTSNAVGFTPLAVWANTTTVLDTGANDGGPASPADTVNISSASAAGALTNFTITTGALGNDTVNVNGAVNLAGNLNVTTGNVLDNAGGTITTAGNINLGARDAVSLAAAVNAGAGTVTIAANQDGAGAQGFAQLAGGSIQTTNATAAAVAISVNTPFGGAGGATLGDNITVGSAGTIAVTTAPVGNTTGGSITSTGGTLSASAGTVALTTPVGGSAGVGASGNPIHTTTATLTATSGSGGIFVSETDDLSEINLNAGAGSGNVVLTAGGSIQSADAAADVIANTATLTSTGGNVGAAGANNDIGLQVHTLTVDTSGANGNQFLNNQLGSPVSTVLLNAGGAAAGIITLTGGEFDLASGSVISDNSEVVVQSGATLNLNGFSETIGSLAGAGSVRLPGASLLTTGGGNVPTTTFTGVLGGPLPGDTGGLTKIGTGTFTLGGAAANTYSGNTTVQDGTLALNKSAGVNAVAANLIIGDAVGAAGSAAVLSLASEQIQDGFGVTMYSDGLWDLNGQTEAIGYLQTPMLNTAEVRLTGSGSQLTTGAALSSVFGGAITGAGSLIKQGATTFTLTSGSTYTGTTTINAGALALTGSLTGTGGNVILAGSNTALNGAGSGVITGRGVVVNAGVSGDSVQGLANVTNAAGTGITVFGTATVSANRVTNSPTGIAVTGGTASLSNDALSNDTLGILVNSGGSATFNAGNSIAFGTTGLQVDGLPTTIANLSLGNMVFTGQSGNYITFSSDALIGPQLVDGSAATYDGVVGQNMTTVQEAAAENKITDYLDDPTLGLIVLRTKSAAIVNGNLVVFGSNGADNITVNTSNVKGVTVTVNSVAVAGSPFDLSALNNPRVIVWGMGGNDFIQTAGNLPTEQHGGDGNDTLFGGSGDDVLFGETGNDFLNGGPGNNVLMGGLGRDTLTGGSNNDILIGGQVNPLSGYDNYTALTALMTAWIANSPPVGLQNSAVTADPVDAADQDLLGGGSGREAFVYRSGAGGDLLSGIHSGDAQLGY